MVENAKIWRINAFDNMELLKAQYVSQTFPKHYHDTFCIGLIEQGAEFLAFNNKKLVANAGKVVLIDPGVVHANYAFDPDGWNYRMIYLNPEVMTFLAGQAVYTGNQVIDHPQLFELILNFHRLAENLQSPSMVLRDIVQLLAQIGEKCPPEPQKRLRERFQVTQAFIDEHYTEKISMAMLEQVAGLNKYKLIRIFKQQLGLTPFEYILLRRVELAKKQLLQNQALSQIALEVGFYDQSNFTRYFKKYTGVSPQVYRKGCNILQDK
ncbi:MAG TPA: hypothetical protein DCS93_39650 [Microscillaceae bacterium]|nr:hypothetical protein [Microscillaceae bacterium]